VGVGLVFASEASGLSYMKDALRRFIPPDLPPDTGLFTEIPPRIVDGEELATWLERRLGIYSQHERLIFYRRLATTQRRSLESLVRGALDFCEHHPSHQGWLRVLFSLDARASWEWLSIPPDLRAELEHHAYAHVTFPQRWSLAGLSRRLAQHGKMYEDTVCKHILVATGGWHCLLSELFGRCAKRTDARPSANEIREEVADPSQDLSRQFLGALGLSVNPMVHVIAGLLSQAGEKGIETEYVTPDLIEGESDMTVEECLRTVTFLERMACVDRRGDVVSLETTVARVIPKP